jgi:hypothetical protein
MTKAATPRSLKPVSLADRLDELAGRFGLALAGTLPLSQLPDIREAIQELRTEAENRGMVGRSRALGRIGLLTEVWECLATDPENRADEVGFFCAQALPQRLVADRCPGLDLALPGRCGRRPNRYFGLESARGLGAGATGRPGSAGYGSSSIPNACATGRPGSAGQDRSSIYDSRIAPKD